MRQKTYPHIRCLRQQISQYMWQYFCQTHVIWYVTLNVNKFVQIFSEWRDRSMWSNLHKRQPTACFRGIWSYSTRLDGKKLTASGLRSNKALRRWLDVPPQGEYALPNFTLRRNTSQNLAFTCLYIISDPVLYALKPHSLSATNRSIHGNSNSRKLGYGAHITTVFSIPFTSNQWNCSFKYNSPR